MMSSADAALNSSLLLDDELGVPPDATLTVSSRSNSATAPVCFCFCLLSSSATDPTTTTTTATALAVAPESCTTRDRATARCLVVGRQAASADWRIPHGSISRRHAVLFYQPNDDHEHEHEHDGARLKLMDLGTKYGTTVNDQRVPARTIVELHDGDRVYFGNVRDQVFQVQVKHKLESSNDDTLSAAVEAAGTKKKPNSELDGNKSDDDETSHLTDREKRQREIAAMVASLDEKPVYTKYQTQEHSEQAGTGQQQQQQQLETLKLAHQHRIPVQHHLRIESESDRPRTTVSCLAVDPAGSRFAVGLTDMALRLYDFAGMHQAHRAAFAAVVPDEGHWPVACAFSPTGDRLLVGTGSAQPVVLDREGALVLQFVRGDMYVNDQSKTVGHTAAVTSVDWHPLERDVVLTGSRDGSARLWNLNGRTQFEKLVCQTVWPAKNTKGQRTPVTSVAFHPSGRELALGTACGSVQIYKTDKVSARPDRTVLDAHGPAKTVLSLAYNRDGKQLVTRSSEDSVLHLWNAARLSRSSRPTLRCTQAPTLSEHANVVFGNTILCATVSEMIPGPRHESSGRLNFYQIHGTEEGGTVAPLVSVPLPQANVSPTVVQWHAKLNQIFVGCSNGDTIIFYGDDNDDVRSSSAIQKSKPTKKGAAVVANRAGRTVDPLTELLQTKAPTGSAALTGEILTPLLTQTRHHHKRKRQQEEEAAAAAIEPERPAIHKHKTGSQAGGALNFQQFVADQTMGKRKEIAGKDPREELFKYKGNVGPLADKTAEEEEEEAASKGKDILK